MEYQEYLAGPIAFDPDDGVFSGTVLGPKDVIHFEDLDAASLTQSFRDGIDDYLAFCAERGETPDKPFAGNILVRTTPDLHRKAALRAEVEGVSLSQWVARQIEAAR